MRKQVISRTVQTMKVTALLADPVNEQMVEGIFFIEKTEEKEILKSVAKQCGDLEDMIEIFVEKRTEKELLEYAVNVLFSEADAY